MTENSPTLRDLQRQETFERLYETALAEFHRVGVDAARVSEICRLARVAKGTFFFHFPTKDHVLLERQRRLSKAMAERIERELADVPDAKAFLGQLIDIVLSEHQAIGDLELVRLINLAIVRQGGTQRLSVQHTAFGNAAPATARRSAQGHRCDQTRRYLASELLRVSAQSGFIARYQPSADRLVGESVVRRADSLTIPLAAP